MSIIVYGQVQVVILSVTGPVSGVTIPGERLQSEMTRKHYVTWTVQQSIRKITGVGEKGLVRDWNVFISLLFSLFFKKIIFYFEFEYCQGDNCHRFWPIIYNTDEYVYSEGLVRLVQLSPDIPGESLYFLFFYVHFF